MIWLRGKQKTTVERYTEELTNITSQIHQLDKKLKSSEESNDKLQSQLNYYGLATAVLAFSYKYWICEYRFPSAMGLAIVPLVVTGLIKVIASWINQWLKERQIRKLDSLRALHQEKLNKLKEETNFHATSSVIQRFSQGEDQTDDAVLLMDEEIGKKYRELQELQQELNQFRKTGNADDKKERDKWFDKVLNVLAGGDIPRPIICSQCHKHCGAYHLADASMVYVCPLCGWREPPLKEQQNVE